MTAPNPYAAPRATRARDGDIAWGLVLVGLLLYAGGAAVSIPFAIGAAEHHEHLALTGEWEAFNTLAATFYLARAVGDVGFYVAFAAGLVWLYQAWIGAGARGKNMSASAAAVVGWCFVPIWGTWRLLGFLLELARRRGARDGAAVVQRWWWALVAHAVVRVVMTTNHRPGWGHVVDSAIQVGAALLGMHMLWRLQRVSVGARDRSTEV
jgi:hypothetical protein